MHRFSLFAAALLSSSLAPALAATPPADPAVARALKIMATTPMIDGHNDWAESLRGRDGEKRWTIDLNHLPAYNTDISGCARAMVGGQFWSVYVSPNLPEQEQVIETLEQIDLVKDIVARYPERSNWRRPRPTSAASTRLGKIASMMGVEGGGQIDQRFAVLRAYRSLGAGYLTLTHAVTIDWADSATDDPKHDGLTPFGKAVVHELNRLGMLVDLAHVSESVMKDALAVSKAPVIFSHFERARRWTIIPATSRTRC
jgi:membrane dipeptidase